MPQIVYRRVLYVGRGNLNDLPLRTRPPPVSVYKLLTTSYPNRAQQLLTSQSSSASFAVKIPDFDAVVEGCCSEEVATGMPRTTPDRALMPVESQQLFLSVDVPHLVKSECNTRDKPVHCAFKTILSEKSYNYGFFCIFEQYWGVRACN